MAGFSFLQCVGRSSFIASQWCQGQLWVIPAAAAAIGALGGFFIILGRRQVKRRTDMLKREFIRRRQLEEQLHRTQKLKAQGVFHDFNNLFQVIMGCGELAQMDVAEDSTARAFLNQIIDSAEKARVLVKQLTGLGYRNVTNLKRLDLDELLATQIPLLRHVVGEKSTMRFSPVGDGKVIYGAVEQLKQLLQDLTDNARDAMPNGGEIVVTTRKMKLSDNDTQKGMREYVQLTFKDTGSGIPEKYVQRIFEPFFTWGKGSDAVGLGLATVSSIVEGHGGFIEVHTKKGEGTAFAIYFPAVPELNQSDKPMTAPPLRLQVEGGNETILIADDDEAVRDIAVKTLQAAGYQVLVAWDGDEAIRVLEERGNDINLVLLDVVMPGQSGYSVYDSLKKLQPDLPVLFSSGCSHEQLLETYGIDIPRSAMVDKPYRADELLQEVRNQLDK
ncbi:MAG: ATP-binding protein [Lentisphaeria bacterium]|nr:ATP-binding protein [Lentisphaeria bacterium]